MARIDSSSMSGDVRGRIQRTEAYAEQVRKYFAAVVNKISTLRVTKPDISNGEMYSFDGDTIRIRQEVEQLLRQLHSATVLAIEKGISLEWEAANQASDKLLKRVYGSKLLNSNVFKGWNSRNRAAQEEFIRRSDRGMNLSQRVWKSCRQLRDEMEVALTVSIGEGESAGTISRRIRQYLNDPDLMFRRFRYKVKEPQKDDKGNIVYGKDGKPKMVDKLDSAGNPIWARKWKKRVIDHSTGKVTFIDYDKDSYHDQWTGKGYYKSAAQNAMRVARTETNIAYRRADNQRWKQLDFVLGFRVQLSKNHPEYDICDILQGDYPKDFVFDGWHPQCFCYATPILVEPSEMLKRNEALANGEEYTPKGTPITDVPQGFKDWVIENEEKIYNARNRGTEPYFVKNNYDRYVGRILYPSYYEELDRIKAEQQKKILQISSTAANVLGVAKGKFGGLSVDVSKLTEAMASGDTELIKSETKTLAKMLSDLQKKIKADAQSVIADASKYKDFEGSSLLSNLVDISKKNNLSDIQTETIYLEDKIDELKAKLKGLNNLYNVNDWAEEFTFKELELADNAVGTMYGKLKGLSLEDLKDNLEFEAKWVKDHPKYSTSKVVQQAYENKLKDVEEQIQWNDIKTLTATYSSKYSSSFPTLLSNINNAITAKDLNAAQQAFNDLKNWDNIISQRSQLETVLGPENAKKFKGLDKAIAANDITKADKELKKLITWQDVWQKRINIAANLGVDNKDLLEDLDNAIKDGKPLIAKKSLATLEKWDKTFKAFNETNAKIATLSDDGKLKLKELEDAIKTRDLSKAENVAKELENISKSPIERYCDKHYTEKFTVHSQETYDEVMTEMGKVSKPLWTAATKEVKQSFVDYCGSHSKKILSDIGHGIPNERAKRIDSLMDKCVYPHDIVLRSGQNYDMCEYIFDKELRALMEADKIDEINKKYAGFIGKNVAYMSTSFNEEGGFSKQFEFHIFAPKGTPMMNVYVLSPFGKDEGTGWDGASYPAKWEKDGETEIFLGRNLLYKFLRVEKGTGLGGRNRIYIQIVGKA